MVLAFYYLHGTKRSTATVLSTFNCSKQRLRPIGKYWESFRKCDIFSYTEADDPSITALFNQLLDALRICEGKKKGTASPVAVAKTLHLLAPAYFPLWDDKIAKAYDCKYAARPTAQYIAFLRKMKHLAEHLGLEEMATDNSTKTALKLLDEFSYARYTKRWV
jgi:hypothetical protein